MAEKLLFVDDEPNILSGIQRQLRKEYEILTAAGGAAGLDVLSAEPDVAVIISDMRMPEMNGAQFLAKARTVRPDAVQMILSGQAELDATIQAVNEGSLFRFLTKPCERDVLVAGVEAGLKQYRLVMAERDLLQRTLGGSVQLLTEVLSLVNPVAFSRTTRVQRYAMSVAETLGLQDLWKIRLAAMLSQLGCVTVPVETLNKIFAGREVTEDEAGLYGSHAQVAGNLIGRIPRLEGVARIINAHSGTPDEGTDVPASEEEEKAADVLRAVADFDLMLARGVSVPQALQRLAPTTPKPIIEAISVISYRAGSPVSKAVTVKELTLRMVLEEDVMSDRGMLLIAKGHSITDTTLVYLRRFAQGQGVKEPFRVLVPQVEVEVDQGSEGATATTAA